MRSLALSCVVPLANSRARCSWLPHNKQAGGRGEGLASRSRIMPVMRRESYSFARGRWLFSVTLSFISLSLSPPSPTSNSKSPAPSSPHCVGDGRINACCVIRTGCGLSSASAAAKCTKAWRPFFYFSDGEDEAARYQSDPLLRVHRSVCPCSTNR